jgi:ribosomal protein L29
MTSYKGKAENELRKELIEKRGKLRDFRFAMAGSKVKNNREGRQLRREIAQILTELATIK